MNYYRRLKDLRIDHDLKQSEVAHILRLHKNQYWRYENGYRAVPADVLIQLASLYHTSIDYLLELTDEKTAYPPSKKILQSSKDEG